MTISRLGLATMALAVLLAGYAAGRIASASSPDTGGTSEVSPSPRPLGSATSTLPLVDVAGSDIDGLPRYPGAVRTEYVVEEREAELRTEAEYFVGASLDETRSYYRAVFEEHGWTVADQAYAWGEWVFYLVREQTEARVRVEERRVGVEIDLRLSVPLSAPTPTAVAPPPAPVAPADGGGAPPPPPVPLDDEGGGDVDQDGE